MIPSNPVIGTGLHAIGGIAASSCYVPYQKTNKWSWNTFWLVQSFFAWVFMPVLIGFLTVPGFFNILVHAPSSAFWSAFLLGAAYGFGGMSFGLAITHIGYSLTYTLAIGISAVLGTIFPLVLNGELLEHFSKPGGLIVLAGMVISLVGVMLCGWAGFRKEKELQALEGNSTKFNMAKGTFIIAVAGVLSAVFNISLVEGKPIADMAAQNGAGYFQGNANLVVSTLGCYLVNLIWFIIVSVKQKTLVEFSGKSGITTGIRIKNFLWSMLAGTLWCMQFFFYNLGHVKMGRFQFASWVLHMSMLIFFSYIVGVLMREWKSVKKSTYIVLVFALITLVLSFVITAYGSAYGENVLQMLNNK